MESKYPTAYSDVRMKLPESTPLEVFLFKEMVVDRMAAATQKVKTATDVKGGAKAAAAKVAQEHWII